MDESYFGDPLVFLCSGTMILFVVNYDNGLQRNLRQAFFGDTLLNFYMAKYLTKL